MKNKILAAFCLLFFSVLAYGQNITVSISPQNPSICSGAEVKITATPSGGVAPYSFAWSNGGTAADITVNKALTYTVTVTDATGKTGTQSVTVTAVTTPEAPQASNTSGPVCLGSPARLEATGPGGTYNWYDANGNYKFTGAVYNTDAITQNTTYFVDATVGTCTGKRTTVNVTLIGSPTVPPVSVCKGSPATFTASGATTYQWYDDAGNALPATGPTFTTDPLNTSRSYFVTGTLNGCTSAKVEAKATVKDAPPAPNGGGPYNDVCTSSKVTLSASGVNGAVYDWFDVPTGGTSLISSPDFTTPVLTQSRSYWVQATLDGCPGPRTEVPITVNPPPQVPTGTSNSSVCYNSPAQLSVSNPVNGENYEWFNSATAAAPFAYGVTIQTAALTSDITFYVRAVRGSCFSDRAPVPVTVKQPADPPTITGTTLVCRGTGTTLTATNPGGTYEWFTTQTGGNSFFTGPVYSTPNLNNPVTYYVETTLADGCKSLRTAITVNIITPPGAPTGTGGSTCVGGSARLTAANGTNYQWYAAQTGGTPIGSGRVFDTPALTTTTSYYVESVDANGCASTRTQVTATVIPPPAEPNVSGPGTICDNTSAQLTASGSPGGYEWWDAPTGGTRLATTAVFNTPILTTTTKYYVQAVTPEGCTSTARKEITVNVTNVVKPQFLYSSGTYCVTSPNPTPVNYNPGGLFSASPAGLTIDPTTGQIITSTSSPGTYTVTYTPPGGNCATPSSVAITITPVPDAHFTYNKTQYCQDDPAPNPIFPANASAGVFTSTTALIFVDPTTGQINLKRSAPGKYVIKNTISAPCGTVSETFSVEIFKEVIVDAGPDQNVPVGGTAQLAGSVNQALNVTWSAPSGSFSNKNALNSTYKPSITSGTVTLTLTTSDPAGPCDPNTDKVIITVAPKPAKPTAPGTSVCAGDRANLSAIAPGGAYEWFDAPTNGNLLGSGPNYKTDPLTITTTFYVQTTINGATSDRTSVVVTVNQPPPTPTVSGNRSVCKGVPATLTVDQTANTYTYNWYDAAGKLQFNGQTFSPTINQNTSFSVEIVEGTCVSQRTIVDLTVNPTATVTSDPTGETCSGQAQNYIMKADIATATFTYSRAFKNGISEPAVPNTQATAITETLTNTTNASVDVEYVITPYVNNCPGTPAKYTVTVFPEPKITSGLSKTICNEEPVEYTVQINPDAINFSWSRDQVPGISNTSVSGQESRTIHEVLFNTTNAPIAVEYIFNYSTLTCAGQPFKFTVMVNPPVKIDSKEFQYACSGQPVGYEITSNAAGATFTWQRLDANGNLLPKHTTKIIDEVLTNTGSTDRDEYYYVVPSLNGCEGTPSTVHIIVRPQLAKPKINPNGPVCLDNAVILQTDKVQGASYVWTLPDGSKTTTPDPILNIPATTAGPSFTYGLTVMLNECSADADPVTVTVNEKPVATAPNDGVVCPTVTQINIHGEISGGTTTGLWSIVTGSGKLSQTPDKLDNVYEPTPADTLRGYVVLALTSTSKDDCTPAVDEVRYDFKRVVAANAGNDQPVCNQGAVTLNGQVFTAAGTGRWTAPTGDGSFNGTEVNLNAVYTPGPNDILSGKVTLTLTADGANIPCDIASDDVVITLQPPPTVNAGPTRYVLTGKTVTLMPTVSDENVTYSWLPVTGLSDPSVKNPVVTGGTTDITYSVIVTNSLGCISDPSEVLVKVSPPVIIPNTITPNSDGINDTWKIEGIEAYPQAVINVYNRYGQPVFHSVGYGKPWDGTNKGKPLPFGTYYFIIDAKAFDQKFSGYITVVK